MGGGEKPPDKRTSLSTEHMENTHDNILYFNYKMSESWQCSITLSAELLHVFREENVIHTDGSFSANMDLNAYLNAGEP